MIRILLMVLGITLAVPAAAGPGFPNHVTACHGESEAPMVELCPPYNDYKDYVDEIFDRRLDPGHKGDLAAAGLTATDPELEHLKRGYMLPCRVKVNVITPSNKPPNVARVMGILPQPDWEKLVAKDVLQYEHGAENGEHIHDSFSYQAFLEGLARFPYLCGERGLFESEDEACKRELAGIIAHGLQETGDGGRLGSLASFIRESGAYPDADAYDPGPQDCALPAVCCNLAVNAAACNGKVHYFGRGLKQISYFYNYIGFSAAYYGGDQFNHLLKYPDRVGCDGSLAFSSGLWFHMNTQNPKPSIHDVMIGRYAPQGCRSATDCGGIVYSSTQGVNDPFEVSISVVNGGVECGTTAGDWAKRASKTRSRNYKQLLETHFGASLIGTEVNSREGCEFIEGGNPFATYVAGAGVQPKIWLADCQLVGYQAGMSPLNITADGLLAVVCPGGVTGGGSGMGGGSPGGAGAASATCNQTTTRCGDTWGHANGSCVAGAAHPVNCDNDPDSINGLDCGAGAAFCGDDTKCFGKLAPCP
jgi:hypothetical protein